MQPKSLIQQCFDNIEAEAEARKNAIRSSAGLIAEAEALLDAIKQHMPEHPSIAANVYDYGREKAKVVIYVWGNYLAFFEALAKLGIETSEIESMHADGRGHSKRTLRLAGFDVPATLEGEIQMQEAA